MKQKLRKNHSIAKMIPAAVAAVVIGGSALAFAMIDETNSVHINADSIEDSTLIVGSHLIYLGAMTDQIYEIAMESAEDSNQYNRYYKSELSGGAWYDVTEAGALVDITVEGTVVQDKEIEALNMTHHTKSDGITYDLRTGKSVCVFDINDPYDLEGLDELEPIKMQYDTLVQTEDPSETNKRDIKIIKDVYAKNRETSVTKGYDTDLSGLQAYYEILVKAEAEAAMSDMVMTVMEKVDNARRAEVLQPLAEGELEKMNRVVSREFVYIEGEVTGDANKRDLYGAETAEAAESAAKAARAEAESAGKQAIAAAKAAGDKEIAEAEAQAALLISMADADGKAIAKERAANLIAAAKTKAEERVKAAEEKAEKQAENAAKAAEDAVYEEAQEKGRPEMERFTLNTDLVTAIGEAMTNVQESYIEYSSNMLTEGTTVLSQVEYELCIDLIGLAKAKNYAGCDDIVKQLIYLDRVNNNVIREETAERDFILIELLGRAEEAYKALLFAGESEAYRSLSSMAAAATKANVLKQQKNDTEIARNELQFIMQAYIDRMVPESAMEFIADKIDGIGDFRSGIKGDAFEEYAQSSVDSYLEWLNQTMNNLQNNMGNRTMDSLMEQKEKLQTERMTALDNNQLGLANKLDAQIEAIDKQIEDLENYLNDILNSENTSDSEKAKAAAQLGAGSASAVLQEMKNNALEDLKDGNLDGIENIIDGIGALAGTQPDAALAALKDVYQELSKQELMNGGSSPALKNLLRKVEDVTAEQMQNFLEDFSGSDLSQLIDAFLEEKGMGNGAFDEDVFGAESGFGAGMGNDTGADIDFGAGMGSGAGSSGGFATGSETGSNAGTGSDAGGSGTGTGASSSILGGAALDSTMDGLSDGEMAIVLAGLSLYAEQTGSDTVADILRDYTRTSFADGNPYIFEQLASDRANEYVPTDRLARIIGYRYIFNDSQKAVTLQRGSQYYKFKAFSAVAEKGTTMEDMSRAAGFQRVIYIPADTAKSYYGLTVEYFPGTNFAVLITDDMKNLALDFFDYLLEAGGEF